MGLKLSHILYNVYYYNFNKINYINKFIIYVLISFLYKESLFLIHFRLLSLKLLYILKQPDWIYIELPLILYNILNLFFIKYFSNNFKNNKIYYIINKLNLNKFMYFNIDIICNNKHIKYNYKFLYKLKLNILKYGLLYYPFFKLNIKLNKIIKLYFNSIINIGDNFFTTLNSSLFSEGSFIYIPKYTITNIKLGTYFNIIEENKSQFERTLIILNINSYLIYEESCSTLNYTEIKIHVAVVELILKKNSYLYYNTLQNWSENMLNGILNITNKKSICFYKSKMIWLQFEIGSFITIKYPTTLLLGNKSRVYFYSFTLTNFNQIIDTGTKIIHLGNKTKSYVLSKNILLNYSQNIFRSLIYINYNSKYSTNITICDSLLVGNKSLNNTLPYICINNNKSVLQQEAFISNINLNQIFFLMQRAFSKYNSFNIFFNNFCKNILFLYNILKEFIYLIKFKILLI